MRSGTVSARPSPKEAGENPSGAVCAPVKRAYFAILRLAISNFCLPNKHAYSYAIGLYSAAEILKGEKAFLLPSANF